LPELFAPEKNHIKAINILKKEIGLNNSESPFILLWTNIDSSNIVIIQFIKEKTIELNGLKNIYRNIINESNYLFEQNNSVDINKLYNKIKTYKDSKVLDNIELISTEKSFSKILKKVGNFYAEEFEESIANYMNQIEKKAKNSNRFNLRRAPKKNKEITILLKKNGFAILRDGGNHTIYKHDNLHKPTPVPRHKKINPSTVKSILKDIISAKGKNAYITPEYIYE